MTDEEASLLRKKGVDLCGCMDYPTLGRIMSWNALYLQRIGTGYAEDQASSPILGQVGFLAGTGVTNDEDPMSKK
jgi:hypothetical protein